MNVVEMLIVGAAADIVHAHVSMRPHRCTTLPAYAFNPAEVYRLVMMARSVVASARGFALAPDQR